MSVGTPSTAEQVEGRVKVDVQREAPDSNPYLSVSWIRSFIAGFSRRIFDFYGDLNRTETRLFPDTADEETAPIWGNIYVGPQNSATSANGIAIATGTIGSVVPIAKVMTANGNEYQSQSAAIITLKTVSITSLTRSGNTVTAVTDGDHNLTSFVLVEMNGAVEVGYNGVGISITVTGSDSFTYEIDDEPATPATGTITVDYETAEVSIASSDTGASTNLDRDSPLALQSPEVGIDDNLYVNYDSIGGGTGEESIVDYRSRYLDKIRNPVANFNPAAIIAQAKTVSGVTRVFVDRAGTEVGTVSISSIERTGNIAKVTCSVPHGFQSGQTTSILGADQTDYNITDERIIIEDDNIFYVVVFGSPSTPATGTMTATTSVSLGQSITYFMRDNDDDPIPTAGEVSTVKDAINEILPANTSVNDNIVLAPTPLDVNYIFTSLVPDSESMREAVEANIDQFHAEQTFIGVDVDEDAYRAAIKNTVDPQTGLNVQSFSLLQPSAGDISVGSGEIAVKGTVVFA